jgi:hypothetical protein
VLQAVIDARAAYVPTEDEFLSLVSADRLQEAKETLLERTRPAQLAYLDKLEKFNDYEAREIKSAGDSPPPAARRYSLSPHVADANRVGHRTRTGNYPGTRLRSAA